MSFVVSAGRRGGISVALVAFEGFCCAGAGSAEAAGLTGEACCFGAAAGPWWKMCRGKVVVAAMVVFAWSLRAVGADV